MTDLPSDSTSEFGQKLRRIRFSVEKLNHLMKELKNLSVESVTSKRTTDTGVTLRLVKKEDING